MGLEGSAGLEGLSFYENSALKAIVKWSLYTHNIFVTAIQGYHIDTII